jgi:hypothetical protein
VEVGQTQGTKTPWIDDDIVIPPECTFRPMPRKRVTLDSRKSFCVAFDTLRTVAEASCFSYFAFALRYTELCGFAAKNFQTVESTVNDSPARARYASTFSIRSDIGAT